MDNSNELKGIECEYSLFPPNQSTNLIVYQQNQF
jgi:hypothetical protein